MALLKSPAKLALARVGSVVFALTVLGTLVSCAHREKNPPPAYMPTSKFGVVTPGTSVPPRSPTPAPVLAPAGSPAAAPTVTPVPGSQDEPEALLQYTTASEIYMASSKSQGALPVTPEAEAPAHQSKRP